MQLTLKSPANEDEAIELISHLVACMLAYFQDVLILINKLMLAMRNKKLIKPNWKNYGVTTIALKQRCDQNCPPKIVHEK